MKKIYLICLAIILIFMPLGCVFFNSDQQKIYKFSDFKLISNPEKVKLDNLLNKEKNEKYLNNLLQYRFSLFLKNHKERNDKTYNLEIDSLLKVYPNKSREYIVLFFKALELESKNKVLSSKLYHSALEGFEKNKDTTGIIQCYYHLYFLNENFKDGQLLGDKETKENYYKRVIELCKLSHNKFDNITGYYLSLYKVSRTEDKSKESFVLETFSKANKIIDENPGLIKFKELFLMVTSVWYATQNDFKNSEKYAFKTLSLPNLNSGDVNFYNVSVMYYYQNDVRKSFYYFKKADSLRKSKSIQSISNDYIFINHASNLYERLNFNRDSILKIHNQKDSIRLLFDEENRKRMIFELQTKYQSKEKDEKIHQKNKELNYLILLFALALLSLFFISVLFYINKKNKDKLTAEINLKEDIQRVISHDMMSPLLSLEGLVTINIKSLIQNNFDKDKKELHSNLVKQQSYIQNAKLLCQNVINWLWTDKEKKHEEEVGFIQSVENTLLDLKSFFLFHNCDVVIESSLSQNEKCLLDRNAFSVVLRNILTNIIRHSKATKIIIKISMTPTHKIIDFYDNGDPIDEELKENLHLFFNQSSSIKFGGLGLYLIKTFLNKINGKFSFEVSKDLNFSNAQRIIIKL